LQARYHLQERNPCDVLKERRDKVAVAKSVFKYCVSNVAGTWENDGTGEPDFEAVHIESINFEGKPKKQVVKNRKESGCSESIVGEHICHHGDLIVNGGITPEEEPQLFGDRSHAPPSDEGIEQKLITS
jgi:hypothetical protein